MKRGSIAACSLKGDDGAGGAGCNVQWSHEGFGGA